jgi:hypothetical protein
MVILLHVLFKGGGGLNANDDPAGRFLNVFKLNVGGNCSRSVPRDVPQDRS